MIALILSFILSITGTPDRKPSAPHHIIIAWPLQCNWIVKTIPGPGDIVLVIAKKDCH